MFSEILSDKFDQKKHTINICIMRYYHVLRACGGAHRYLFYTQSLTI